MKSKSAAAAAAASLADLHHQGHHHHSGLFGASSPGSGSLLATAPHHLGPFGSGSASTPTSAAQQILNYAAQLSSGKSTSSLQESSTAGSAAGNWDNAMALQMSQLFGSSPTTTSGASPETLAQLNAASQLIAASLLQQQSQQNSNKESQR